MSAVELLHPFISDWISEKKTQKCPLCCFRVFKTRFFYAMISDACIK